MLGGFHTVKYLQHRMEEYITGSELEEPPRQTRVFGVKIVHSVLHGRHYVRSSSLCNKVSNTCQKNYKVFLEKSIELEALYKTFTNRSVATSETV